MASSGFGPMIHIEFIDIQTGELLRFLIMAIGISTLKLSALSKRLLAYPYEDKSVFIIYQRIQHTFHVFATIVPQGHFFDK